VRFTNFYTHASCSPTRSMLLTGVDTHLNGLGAMDEWSSRAFLLGRDAMLKDRYRARERCAPQSGAFS
jgi:arylsulfatase A-like enzyme